MAKIKISCETESEMSKYIKLLSRMSAETFYEKLGYKRVSEPVDYYQVAHVSMIKEL